MHGVNHYKLLNVPKSASSAQIKASYKLLAKKFHPDVNGGDSQQMAKLNEAYRLLSNPHERFKYDKTLEKPKPKPSIYHDSSGFAYTAHTQRRRSPRPQPAHYRRTARAYQPPSTAKDNYGMVWAALLVILAAIVLGAAMKTPMQAELTNSTTDTIQATPPIQSTSTNPLVGRDNSTAPVNTCSSKRYGRQYAYCYTDNTGSKNTITCNTDPTSNNSDCAQ